MVTTRWTHGLVVVVAALLGSGAACPPKQCTPGSQGCECQAGEVCSAGLQCVAGKCEARPAGVLGGPCGDNGACGADATWGALVCAGGTCQPSDCQPGNVGCPCAPGNVCQPVGLQNVLCVGERCQLASCTPERAGQAGCPCNNGACQGDAVCLRGSCRGEAHAGVVVVNPAVRSCDVLLRTTGDAAVRAATFDAAIAGKELQRGRDLSLAFMARGDVSMTGRVASIEVHPAPMGGTPGVEVVRAACADKDGLPVAGIVVRLE